MLKFSITSKLIGKKENLRLDSLDLYSIHKVPHTFYIYPWKKREIFVLGFPLLQIFGNLKQGLVTALLDLIMRVGLNNLIHVRTKYMSFA